MTDLSCKFRPTLESLEGREVPARLVATFPGFEGVWRQEDNGAWTLLSRATPENLVFNQEGDIVGDFGANGLWYFQAGRSQWKELTSVDPEDIAIGDFDPGAKADVFASFEGFGLNRYAGSSYDSQQWTQLHNLVPPQIDAGGPARSPWTGIPSDSTSGTRHRAGI